MILGLILILVGALAIVAAVFTAEGSVQLLGVDIGVLTLFLLGVGSGLAILWGIGLTKWGTKRSLRQRRESKKIGELSEQLDRHEAERRGDDSDGN